jgi:hypothetical protein
MRNKTYSPPSRLITTACFLALAGVAVPLQAGTISGSFDGVSTITPTGTPGVFTQSFSGDGTDDTYGAFTASTTSVVDFSSPPKIIFSDGKFMQIFPDGSFFGTSSGMGTASGSGTASFTVEFVITGGSGIFAEDVGKATVTGTITSTGPTSESITASYVGTITTVPEPSTLFLLAAGITGLVVRKHRLARHAR